MLYLLYLLEILLFLPAKADGPVVNSSYILQRKTMLENMKITLHTQPQNSKVDQLYYKQNLKYAHNYTLLINEPRLCSENTHVFLLIMIRTHYIHHEWRDLLRELLKHFSPLPYRRGITVKHIFMFGKSNSTVFEKRTRIESQKHRDIIQEDFPESYVNLLKKVTMAWKWAVNFCPNAEYVMIANDEVLVDLDKLIYFLLNDYSMQRFDDHFAVCYPLGNWRSNQNKLKQFRVMDKKILYKGEFYPRYCHGYGYVAHIYVINQLYKASFSNPPFMPTDVWIGVLSEKLRLKITDTKYLFVLSNIKQYFSHPFYGNRPGMIAVTDFGKNKGHELSVMRGVMQTMWWHWNGRDKMSELWFKEFYPEENDYFDYSPYLIVSIYTCVVLYVLCRIADKL